MNQLFFFFLPVDEKVDLFPAAPVLGQFSQPLPPPAGQGRTRQRDPSAHHFSFWDLCVHDSAQTWLTAWLAVAGRKEQLSISCSSIYLTV